MKIELPCVVAYNGLYETARYDEALRLWRTNEWTCCASGIRRHFNGALGQRQKVVLVLSNEPVRGAVRSRPMWLVGDRLCRALRRLGYTKLMEGPDAGLAPKGEWVWWWVELEETDED